MSQTPSSTTFRDMVAAISPTWLNGWVGVRYMYSMAIQFDAIGDAAAYAVRARFPDLAPTDAFPYLANDRQIDQGFQESQTSFATRLTQWLDRWAHAGSPFGLLMAVRGYVAPDNCLVATVNNGGVFDFYPVGVVASPTTPPDHLPVQTPNPWIWDSLSWPHLYSSAWWRVWLIIWPSAATWTKTAHTYNDGVSFYGSGPSFTYDWSGTLAMAQNLQALVKKWKSAGTWIPWIIVSFDELAFLPSGGDAYPAGLYGTWTKVVPNILTARPLYAYARYQNAAYLDGVS